MNYNLKEVENIAWAAWYTASFQLSENTTEEELDTYLIPHPLIGKMTLRELLFFTVYHIGHHLKTIKNINKTV